MQEIIKLVKELKVPYCENEPLSLHTSFAIGGPARLFVTPESPRQISTLIKACNEQKIPYYVLGRGTNLLVDDRGYRGVIIQIGSAFSRLKREGNQIRCGAGLSLSKLALFAAQQGLAGLAFSYGIP